MTRDRLWLFDTTLRDGQQTQGVQFSPDEKRRIAETLDALGIDYIEGGWPGANPTDSEFFADPPATRATLTAFGMTKRAGRSAENDDVLAAVLDARTPAVCLVGKTHDFHVTQALGITLEENLDNIRKSVEHVVSKGREALFDAEHFFDGYKANAPYALSCLKAAHAAGARWIVLCDTNGGTLPAEVSRITRGHRRRPARRPPRHPLPRRHRQRGGELARRRGRGRAPDSGNVERFGRTLRQREPHHADSDPDPQGTLQKPFETGISKDNLKRLTRASRLLDDILNRVPLRSAPYVGASAFAHKAGLHASAILKDPATYEHVDPAVVGNQRVVPMSNQAGQSNLLRRLSEMGIVARKGDPALARILDTVKDREAQGYSYDTAQASFELLARAELGQLPEFFEVKRYRVTVERRKNKYNEMVTLSEAVVVVKIGGQKMLSVSESMDETGSDRGPVNALSKALAKDLGPYQSVIDDMKLVDFKVRITQGGTEAVTRVTIDSEDAQGRRWATVGVSPNIVDASFEALLDAINWKLVRDAAPAAEAAQ
jgi:2-isopropylmalate synthase